MHIFGSATVLFQVHFSVHLNAGSATGLWTMVYVLNFVWLSCGSHAYILHTQTHTAVTALTIMFRKTLLYSLRMKEEKKWRRYGLNQWWQGRADDVISSGCPETIWRELISSHIVLMHFFLIDVNVSLPLTELKLKNNWLEARMLSDTSRGFMRFRLTTSGDYLKKDMLLVICVCCIFVSVCGGMYC